MLNSIILEHTGTTDSNANKSISGLWFKAYLMKENYSKNKHSCIKNYYEYYTVYNKLLHSLYVFR